MVPGKVTVKESKERGRRGDQSVEVEESGRKGRGPGS